MTRRPRWTLVARLACRLPLLFLLAAGAMLRPAGAAAQQPALGTIVGVVTDASQSAVPGAQVVLVGTRMGGVSGPDGRFRIGSVPAGTYDLRVQRIGQQPRTQTSVVVRGGQETRADVTVASAPNTLSGVVVSASRRVEKVTDAPATITSIGTDVLDNTVGNTFAAALKEVKGLDFIQVGMTSVAVNARGFNSSFNSRVLMVEDGRIAVIPESGLPIGSLTATPKVDLAGIEVLVGPGSALYGPDAANGVISMRTKDPKQFQGSTFELTGGSRSYLDVQGRHAGVTSSGLWGYKVAGEYQTANDWDNYLRYTSGGSVTTATTNTVREDSLKIPIDWKANVARGSGAIVRYDGDNRLEFNGGMSRTNGVAQTNVGRNQLTDWTYNTLQARYTTPHWYLNAYRGQSKSGKSFALNRYGGQQLTNPGLTADSLRLLSDWPSDGRMYAAEAQGNYILPQLLNTAVVFGVQFRDDVVSSDRQWLTDRITGSDISNTQTGVYAQTTSAVTPFLDVILAGRLDNPKTYERQFSPKAGLVLKPAPDQAVRVTFNKAFKSPSILQTNFFIPDWTSVISIYGNTDGFTVKDNAGAVTATYTPLVPETNKTWEAGYKGILLQNKLYFDGTYYHSAYENFLSPLAVISNPFTAAPTYAYPTANPNNIPVNAQGQIVNAAGTRPVMLTYFNIGKATISGVDIGVNYFATERVELRGTLSTVKLSDVEIKPGYEEATALNAPGTKWTVGGSMHDIGPVTANLSWRNVQGYYFRSGSNAGVIPTFGGLDASLSAKIPQIPGTMLNLSVANLFSCSAESVTYVTPTVPANSQLASEDRKCGFNRKHSEMINMPTIGTMVFLGMRVSR
jgi:iron complex outermembrane receptor protein